MMRTKLDRYLAACHVASKNASKKMILAHLVSVNDIVTDQPNLEISENDIVKVNGEIVKPISLPYTYILFHKPQGVITACSSANKKTIYDILPEEFSRFYPVGRLDKDTEGLLLLTDDGKLSQILTSSKHHVNKTYYVQTSHPLSAEDMEKIRQGITLKDGKVCLPAQIEPVGLCAYELTIQEGKYHQVKRMMQSCLCTVTYLKRIQIGNLRIDDVPLGGYRYLSDEEIQQLLQLKTK